MFNFSTEINISVFNKQGVEGATAAAHALSLPAEAYGNDVSWDIRKLIRNDKY